MHVGFCMLTPYYQIYLHRNYGQEEQMIKFIFCPAAFELTILFFALIYKKIFIRALLTFFISNVEENIF